MKQRGLPGPGRAHYRRHLAILNLERRSPKGINEVVPPQNVSFVNTDSADQGGHQFLLVSIDGRPGGLGA